MLHDHDLSCTEEFGEFVIGVLKVQEQCRTLPYTYLSNASNVLPEMLGGFQNSVSYERDSCAMLDVGASATAKPTFSFDLLISTVHNLSWPTSRAVQMTFS